MLGVVYPLCQTTLYVQTRVVELSAGASLSLQSATEGWRKVGQTVCTVSDVHMERFCPVVKGKLGKSHNKVSYSKV